MFWNAQARTPFTTIPLRPPGGTGCGSVLNFRSFLTLLCDLPLHRRLILLPHPGKQTVQRTQFVLCARILICPSCHIDAVGVGDGGQAVCDHQRRFALGKLGKSVACTLTSLSGSAKAVASSRIRMGAFFQHGAAMQHGAARTGRYTPLVPITVWMPARAFYNIHALRPLTSAAPPSVACGLQTDIIPECCRQAGGCSEHTKRWYPSALPWGAHIAPPLGRCRSAHQRTGRQGLPAWFRAGKDLQKPQSVD